MQLEVFMPAMGETMDEGTIAGWLAHSGDFVRQGQVIAQIETNKAVFELEAPASGVLRVLVPVESVVPVLTPIAFIETSDAAAAASVSTGAPGAVPAGVVTPPAPRPPSGPAPAAPAPQPAGSAVPVPSPGEEAEVLPPDRPPESALGQPVLPSAEGKVGEPESLAPEEPPLVASQAVEVAEEVTTAPATPVQGPEIMAEPAQEPAPCEPALTPSEEPQPSAAPAGRTLASPRARRLAREAGVAIDAVHGSGPGGRVEERDVRAYLEATDRLRSGRKFGGEEAALAVRRVIAERMSFSARTTAAVTLTTEVDATELVGLRERLQEWVHVETGKKLSYDALLVRSVCLAIADCPYMNARAADQGSELVERVNIGIAVDTDRGLLVPVIRDAPSKDILALARECAELRERAQSGAILPGEMQDGSFTITNLGAFGVDAFTPIINWPEIAILGMGRIVQKPAVFQGALAIRQIMTLSLTFDHRVVDGAPAARFLQRIAQLVQDPEPLARSCTRLP